MTEEEVRKGFEKEIREGKPIVNKYGSVKATEVKVTKVIIITS